MTKSKAQDAQLKARITKNKAKKESSKCSTKTEIQAFFRN